MSDYVITANGLAYPGDKATGSDTPPDRLQVEEAKRFITAWGDPTKTIRRTFSSYGLKHDAFPEVAVPSQ